MSKSLGALGLKQKTDYLAIGRSEAGKSSIEGLLPERVTAAVFGRETDLVMQLSSQVATERREAKAKLKLRLLDEFKANSDYTDEELKPFIEVGKVFKRAFK